MIKTTGAEFKRFYTDDQFWPDGQYVEEEAVTANGELLDCFEDYTETIQDSDIVTVEDGVIFDKECNDIGTFEGLFRKWRKLQNTVFLAVEAPKDKADAIRAAIKAAGGKVVK